MKQHEQFKKIQKNTKLNYKNSPECNFTHEFTKY